MNRHYPFLKGNQEAFDVGSRAVLDADSRFNGKGSIGGYRSYCFKKAITKLLTSPTMSRSFGTVEIDYDMDLFDACRDKLGDDSYYVIEQIFKYNYTISEVAEQMDKTRHNVVVILDRALDKLYKELK
jgi:hypothetical protein